MITGINPVRNCIENGYPVIESILSKYPICSEYKVNDGGSTDGTLEALLELSEVYPRITVTQIPDTENIRWDSCTKQVNHMINESHTSWIYLDNADELFHEKDLYLVQGELTTTPHRIMRYPRQEVTHNWGKLSNETYYPARAARTGMNLHMDWNPYGGDEFLYDDGWHDPERRIQSKITLYHLLNMFPDNKLAKLRHDAEYISPGDKRRVDVYNLFKESKFNYYKPTHIYEGLPALAKGLAYMSKYEVRECLFNPEWVETVTGLCYSSPPKQAS